MLVQAKNPETSFEDTVQIVADFNTSIDLLNKEKLRSGSYIQFTKSYSLTADNKVAQDLNNAARTELFTKFKAKDMVMSAKIEFGNFEKKYGELDIPKIALMLNNDKSKGWADIPKQRGAINFTKDIKENEDAKIKWQAKFTGDKYEIVETISAEGKFMI